MKRKLFTLVFLSLAGWLFSQDIDVPREQKSLVTKLTATWCPICGDAAWDIYENLVRDAEGKAVVLAAHYSGSSELYSQTAVELINAYHGRPSGQPIFYFNQDKVSSNVENQVLGKVNDAYAAGPMAQTGIVLEYDLTNKELVARTRTQFFQSASGEYYLSVLLVEREVSADQAGRSANALHKRVLRKSVTTETLGRLLAS